MAVDPETDLTDAGWPRPIVDGWPVPWVSPPRELAQLVPGRTMKTAGGRVCGVCGVAHGTVAFIVINGPPPENWAEAGLFEVQATDGNTLHARCLLLSLEKCPALKGMIAENRLLVLEADPAQARVDTFGGDIKSMFSVDAVKFIAPVAGDLAPLLDYLKQADKPPVSS